MSQTGQEQSFTLHSRLGQFARYADDVRIGSDELNAMEETKRIIE